MADGARRDIAAALRSGKQPRQIIEDYVAEHGTEFRATPKNKGFGRLPWTLPYAAIGLAALVVFGILKTWSLKPDPSETPAESPEGDAYLRRVDEEISEEE